MSQDRWFRYIAGDVLKVLVDDTNRHIASLTFHIDEEISWSLRNDIWSLQTFIDDSSLRMDYINQFNVSYSLIEPLLSLILTHKRPNSWLLCSGKDLIDMTLKLIAGSSDIESACTTVRNLDIIATVDRLLPHCDTIRGSINDQSTLIPLGKLRLMGHSLLSVIATPFTGVSVTSNSNCTSVLEDHGWPTDALAVPIPHIS
ncbi:hypothetical protein BU17DRAFT_100514 [Hysterangium stoloniferum]|nr:hypothetical protein BU17DRAFT_100514 [Hysterangium stoloniferum]